MEMRSKLKHRRAVHPARHAKPDRTRAAKRIKVDGGKKMKAWRTYYNKRKNVTSGTRAN